MIPSNNDPKITAESFVKTQGLCPRWTCDCCQRSYEQDWVKENVEPGILVPIFVMVKEVKYFACGKDCARILFSIHHQYAVREPDPKKRFAKLWTPGYPEKTHLLDLDTVSRISVEEHVPHWSTPTEQRGPGPNDWVFLTWWTSDSTDKAQHGMPRSYATEVIELWTARPTIVRHGGMV